MRALTWVVCLASGNFLVNGLLHLMMGLFGKKFIKRPRTVSQSQFEKVYAGRLFSSAAFNAAFGLAQIFLTLLVLHFTGPFRFGFTTDAALLLAGIAGSAIFLAWKYEGAIG